MLTWVLSVATRLRCASRGLALCGERGEPPPAAPAWGPGRWGVRRVGYDTLTRPKAHAEEWVWSVAHTDPGGPHKGLLL